MKQKNKKANLRLIPMKKIMYIFKDLLNLLSKSIDNEKFYIIFVQKNKELKDKFFYFSKISRFYIFRLKRYY